MSAAAKINEPLVPVSALDAALAIAENACLMAKSATASATPPAPVEIVKVASRNAVAAAADALIQRGFLSEASRSAFIREAAEDNPDAPYQALEKFAQVAFRDNFLSPSVGGDLIATNKPSPSGNPAGDAWRAAMQKYPGD